MPEQKTTTPSSGSGAQKRSPGGLWHRCWTHLNGVAVRKSTVWVVGLAILGGFGLHWRSHRLKSGNDRLTLGNRHLGLENHRLKLGSDGLKSDNDRLKLGNYRLELEIHRLKLENDALRRLGYRANALGDEPPSSLLPGLQIWEGSHQLRKIVIYIMDRTDRPLQGAIVSSPDGDQVLADATGLAGPMWVRRGSPILVKAKGFAPRELVLSEDEYRKRIVYVKLDTEGDKP